LLNGFFVPVYVDGTYLEHNAAAAPEEKAALDAVFRSFHELNERNRAADKAVLSVGTVHVYLLTPDGKPLDSLHVAQAGPKSVVEMLKRAISELKTPQGRPLIEPALQSVPPSAGRGELVLHLVTRYLVDRKQPHARGNIEGPFVPLQASLGEENSGQWTAVPSEDWIVVDRSQCEKLLPKANVAIGDSWEIDQDLAKRLLVRFYPTTENNDLATNRIDRLDLKATVVSLDKGQVRARVDGSLTMKHAFYPNRDDENLVEATIIGYIDFDPAGTQVKAIRLIADPARYGTMGPFGAALETCSAAVEQ
jgi:hypothetical protein